MKFVKLRQVITRGAIRVVYKDGDDLVKESFRSMDAVPEAFDNAKIQYIAGCDNIMIEPKKGDELVAVRGIEARLEDKSSSKDKKKKKKDKKEKKKMAEELGIPESVITDPTFDNDSIDNALNDNESED